MAFTARWLLPGTIRIRSNELSRLEPVYHRLGYSWEDRSLPGELRESVFFPNDEPDDKPANLPDKGKLHEFEFFLGQLLELDRDWERGVYECIYRVKLHCHVDGLHAQITEYFLGVRIERALEEHDAKYSTNIANRARRYLDSPWMHCSFIAGQLASRLLRATENGLARFAGSRETIWFGDIYPRSLFAYYFPVFVSLLLFSTGAVIVAGLFYLGMSWIAIPTGGLLCWRLYRHYRIRREAQANRTKAWRFTSRLALIRQLESGVFNKEEVARRLREIECEGVIEFPTLVCSLLDSRLAKSEAADHLDVTPTSA